MNNQVDIAIAYRIYPKVSKVPPIFPNDKYKLSELCLKSFANSLTGLNIKFYAILDGCPDEYEDLFKKYIFSENLEIIRLPGIGNAGTFHKQIEILLNQDDTEYIYFAEDDYFYLPDQFHYLLDIIKDRDDIDFVSPYDHLDYYELKLHDYPTQVFPGNNYHWRHSATTCMTFLTTKSTLRRTKSIFETYTRNNYDASIWLSLSKTRIYNPLLWIKFLFDVPMLKIFIKSWLHTPIQNILGKSYKLATPIPSIATHMDSKHLAPSYDWDKYFEKLI